MKQLICALCGSTFKAMRRSAKHCSNACKQKVHRIHVKRRQAALKRSHERSAAMGKPRNVIGRPWRAKIAVSSLDTVACG
jgi:hypothetical protein